MEGKKGGMKRAAASFMIPPQKCQLVLANIYRAALSAIYPLTYSSITAFHQWGQNKGEFIFSKSKL